MTIYSEFSHEKTVIFNSYVTVDYQRVIPLSSHSPHIMGPWSKPSAHVPTVTGPWHVVAELLLEPHRDAAVVPYKTGRS